MQYRCLACDGPTARAMRYCSEPCRTVGQALYQAASGGASWLQAADRHGVRPLLPGIGRAAHALTLARRHALDQRRPWPPAA